MKNMKRVLAVALALLLSFAPTFGVRAAETETPEDLYAAYNQLMHGSAPTGLDYDVTNSANTAIGSAVVGTGVIFTETDAEGNTYLKFDNYVKGTASTYVDLKHGQTDNKKLVFEADFCYNDTGLYVEFFAN